MSREDASGAFGWAKSSFSFANGNCLEVGGWRKSSRSVNNGACVEAGQGPRTVLVRDTTDRDGTVLSFTAGAWAEFTAGISGAGQ